MTYIYTAEQGSEEWLAARRGVVTCSRFKDARERKRDGSMTDKCQGYAMDLARERAGGAAPQVYVNAAMRQGTEQEPLARAAYAEQQGLHVEQTGFWTTDDGMFGASPDGLVGENGLIEIKTMVSSQTLFRAVVNRDLSDYLDQINGALWISGRSWCDLVLWAPDLEPIGRHLTVIRITRDEDEIDAMVSDLMEFSRLVTRLETQLRQPLAA